MKLLEDWTLVWWGKLSFEEQYSFRDLSLKLLRNIDILRYPKLIRLKISKLISEVAKRQYPHHWDHFIEELVSCWTTSSDLTVEVCTRCTVGCNDLSHWIYRAGMFGHP